MEMEMKKIEHLFIFLEKLANGIYDLFTFIVEGGKFAINSHITFINEDSTLFTEFLF